MENQMYHTPEQIQQKRDAIDSETRKLALDYIQGKLASCPELLYNRIDNLYALLMELRRG